MPLSVLFSDVSLSIDILDRDEGRKKKKEDLKCRENGPVAIEHVSPFPSPSLTATKGNGHEQVNEWRLE